MKISIVIPNYNGKSILEKNFPSVWKALEAYDKEKELIYVDDGSSDGSIDILRKFENSHKPIKVLVHTSNKGFSSAVNTGVRAATGDIVILLNTDVRPENEFLRPLLKHFSDDLVFAVACMDRSIEQEKEVLRGRGVGKWSKGFLMHSAGKLDKENSLWASGGSSAFRRTIWERLGGMNELYNPFYWEDVDLSYRALRCGYDVHFEKDSVVIHEHETGAIKSAQSEQKISEIAYRNQIQFVWLNITSIPKLFTHLLWLKYYVFRSLFSSDKNLWKGYILALKHLPKILKYRSKMTRDFVKSDESVLASHNT